MLCLAPAWVLVSVTLWTVHGERGKGMRPFFSLTGAGGFFFLSAWLLMIFAGILHDEVGINPFGYGTSLLATIGLWLVLAPAAGAIASSMRQRG
jgi:hypothetical protein